MQPDLFLVFDDACAGVASAMFGYDGHRPKLNLQVRAGNTETIAFYEAVGYAATTSCRTGAGSSTTNGPWSG